MVQPTSDKESKDKTQKDFKQNRCRRKKSLCRILLINAELIKSAAQSTLLAMQTMAGNRALLLRLSIHTHTHTQSLYINNNKILTIRNISSRHFSAISFVISKTPERTDGSFNLHRKEPEAQQLTVTPWLPSCSENNIHKLLHTHTHLVQKEQVSELCTVQARISVEDRVGGSRHCWWWFEQRRVRNSSLSLV